MLIVIALTLGVYGAYSLWTGIAIENLLYVFFGVLSMIGAIGLALKKRWARFLVYLMALVISGSLIYAIIYQYSTGAANHRTIGEHLIGLLPSVFIFVICAGSSFIVSKRLRNKT